MDRARGTASVQPCAAGPQFCGRLSMDARWLPLSAALAGRSSSRLGSAMTGTARCPPVSPNTTSELEHSIRNMRQPPWRVEDMEPGGWAGLGGACSLHAAPLLCHAQPGGPSSCNRLAGALQETQRTGTAGRLVAGSCSGHSHGSLCNLPCSPAPHPRPAPEARLPPPPPLRAAGAGGRSGSSCSCSTRGWRTRPRCPSTGAPRWARCWQTRRCVPRLLSRPAGRPWLPWPACWPGLPSFILAWAWAAA